MSESSEPTVTATVAENVLRRFVSMVSGNAAISAPFRDALAAEVAANNRLSRTRLVKIATELAVTPSSQDPQHAEEVL